MLYFLKKIIRNVQKNYARFKLKFIKHLLYFEFNYIKSFFLLETFSFKQILIYLEMLFSKNYDLIKAKNYLTRLKCTNLCNVVF